MIHDVLSSLRQKTKSFSIYVSGLSREGYMMTEKENARKLLPRLYDEGFVRGAGIGEVWVVSHCSLLFSLLHSLSSHLAPNSFWSGATTNDVIPRVAVPISIRVRR